MANYAENRKAGFDYEILETLEAGLVLTGQEVKSVRMGRGQIAGSYIIPRGNELFLIGATIPPYQPLNAPSSYDPQRSRKLLLHKKETRYLFGKSRERGLTLVPIRLYNKGAQIKLEFALARGKKQHDKRQTLKKRDADREMRSFQS
ncbi:MAG: SsrA-binding protein SmpB [Candidatus Wildermuthbacteria bacterium]|nr:SsrA-binding protein SmpB [Candidatus Wildermuthbacteria bacterium]